MRYLNRNYMKFFLSLVIVFIIFSCSFYFNTLPSYQSNPIHLPSLRGWNTYTIKSVDHVSYLSDGSLGNYEIDNYYRTNFTPDGIQSNAGSRGDPYILPSEFDDEVRLAMAAYGMNMAASDRIALDRDVPDTRDLQCKHWNYPSNLPNVSVILVFHNEGLSVLFRTIISIMKRSPYFLLHEILLVDDFSDKQDLRTTLTQRLEQLNTEWYTHHITQHTAVSRSLIRVHRTDSRLGLIRARSLGAVLASGTVLVYLDAHCEVNTNWLPPLLAPIADNSKTMTVPFIDGIDHSTFHYRPVYAANKRLRGIFEWGLFYKEIHVKPSQFPNLKRSEPYPSPTHAGGLFAIDRLYFLELGTYDPGLLVWGGENFELSFKIWQCGGKLLWVPCSRVGHVYRSHMPYSFGGLEKGHKGSLIHINYKRVVETWFDEKYKEYFYTREPLARYLDAGNISTQVLFKTTHNCQSFNWYIRNVAQDLVDDFPELPPNSYWGGLKNVAEQKCVDTEGRAAPSQLILYTCHGRSVHQLLRLNTEGQLATGERCIEIQNSRLMHVFCILGTVDGPWIYDHNSEMLRHRTENRCLGYTSKQLTLHDCDSSGHHSLHLQWQWMNITL